MAFPRVALTALPLLLLALAGAALHPGDASAAVASSGAEQAVFIEPAKAHQAQESVQEQGYLSPKAESACGAEVAQDDNATHCAWDHAGADAPPSDTDSTAPQATPEKLYRSEWDLLVQKRQQQQQELSGEDNLDEEWKYFATEMRDYSNEVVGVCQEVARHAGEWAAAALEWSSIAARVPAFTERLPQADPDAPEYTADVASYASALAGYALDLKAEAQIAEAAVAKHALQAEVAGLAGWTTAREMPTSAADMAHRLDDLQSWWADLSSFFSAWYENTLSAVEQARFGNSTESDVAGLELKAEYLVDYGVRVKDFAAEWATYSTEIGEWARDQAEYIGNLGEESVNVQAVQVEAEAQVDALESSF